MRTAGMCAGGGGVGGGGGLGGAGPHHQLNPHGVCVCLERPCMCVCVGGGVVC